MTLKDYLPIGTKVVLVPSQIPNLDGRKIKESSLPVGIVGVVKGRVRFGEEYVIDFYTSITVESIWNKWLHSCGGTLPGSTGQYIYRENLCVIGDTKPLIDPEYESFLI